jgi:ABC-type branched-subunit amino acid transport system ATPase component
MSAAMLQLQNIGHCFGGFEVLKDVSFAVPQGGTTGLMGPNGSGKTTLFNIVSGFLFPASGTVYYRDRDIRHDTVQARSLGGLVRTFQTPKVFDRLSVAENVMVGAYKRSSSSLLAGLMGSSKARAEMVDLRERAYQTCCKFDLGAMFDKPSSLLAAGQRRLLELARAYEGRPDLLLLDEPSSGLTTTEIGALIEKLNWLAADGMTTLLVSHDMELMRIASQVHVLNFGRIIASGTMAEVQNDASVREAYLGI